jgi:anhydro-N-acetylmuramic acid kinase
LTHLLRELFHGNALALCQVEVEFSNFSALCISRFLETSTEKPDYIASHGHTVFHQPEHGLTKQIGCGAIIAAKTGISTICDFRTTDVALKGQGAPLVPIGDLLLFPQYDGCLNLGGISNLSKKFDKKIVAYDISLCNIPLNYLANQCNLAYDKEGKLAKKGKINFQFLEALNQPDYFRKTGAKSIGFEWFDKYYLPVIDGFSISVEDKLRTMCEHIALQISNHLLGLKKILVTGGGAKNSYLIQLIKDKTDTLIDIPDEQLIDFKEALLFAFLGYLRVHEANNCLQSVTGATRNSCGGAIYL